MEMMISFKVNHSTSHVTIKFVIGSNNYDKSGHDNSVEATFTSLKKLIQVFSLNVVWYKPDLVLDLFSDEE